MTPELNIRWKKGDAPFDGWAAVTFDEPEIATVREMINFCADFLESKYPCINICHDWHEHDGFELSGKSISWQKFREMILDTKSLYNSRDEDDSVRIDIYPENYDWLLRFNIDDENESDYLTAWCDFDISISENSSAKSLIEKLIIEWPVYIQKLRAKEYFDSSYGG